MLDFGFFAGVFVEQALLSAIFSYAFMWIFCLCLRADLLWNLFFNFNKHVVKNVRERGLDFNMFHDISLFDFHFNMFHDISLFLFL